jgi:hypothetical protein
MKNSNAVVVQAVQIIAEWLDNHKLQTRQKDSLKQRLARALRPFVTVGLTQKFLLDSESKVTRDCVTLYARNKNAPQFPTRRFVFSEWLQAPTLASSSLFSTFTILNCSACMPVSARKDSLPK